MAQTVQTIGIANGGIESATLDEAVGENLLVDPEGSMVRMARAVGITFGDQ